MTMKVTFGEIEAGQGNVSSATQKLEQTLEDLKQRIAPVVETWQGAAFEAYQEKQNRWNMAQQDLNQVLASIATALSTTLQNYIDAENANKARFM